MTKMSSIEAREERPRLGKRAADALFVAMTALGYFAVFAATRDGGIGDPLVATLRNVLPLALVATAAREFVQRRIVERDLSVQIVGHAGLAALFTLGWYWLVTVAGGVLGGKSALQFSVAPFILGPALTWQLLQSLAIYGMVAALSHLQAQRPAPELRVEPALPEPPDTEPAPNLQRYFIKAGEDIVPVDVADIVGIAGADDYAQVTTVNGNHLARMTLAEFEARSTPRRSCASTDRGSSMRRASSAPSLPAGGGCSSTWKRGGPSRRVERARDCSVTGFYRLRSAGRIESAVHRMRRMIGRINLRSAN